MNCSKLGFLQLIILETHSPLKFFFNKTKRFNIKFVYIKKDCSFVLFKIRKILARRLYSKGCYT